MKLFIPTIGVTLKLTSPATVKVYFESRNNQFLDRLGVYMPQKAYNPYTREDYYVASRSLPALSTTELAIQKKYSVVLTGNEFCTVTLPEGSELTVSRIYLRKGVPDYDSVTFILKKAGKNSVYGRFWLKLEDVNTMEVEVSRSVEDVKAAKVVRIQKKLEKELKEKHGVINEILILKRELDKNHYSGRQFTLSDLEKKTQSDLYFLEGQLKDQLLSYLSRNQIREILGKGI